MPIIRPEDGKPKVIYIPETPLVITGIEEAHEKVARHQESDFDPIPDVPAPNFYGADKLTANANYGKVWDTDAVSAYPAELTGISVYFDQESDVELFLARDGQTLTIRVGTDRLELSGREWRGLYSGVLNVGPGRGE